MQTVASVTTALAEITRPDKAAAWDSVGLQLGDPAGAVHRVAVCHEVTESNLERILANPPDLVVSYHPLLFRPTNRFVAGSTPAGRAWRLVSAGVALLVTHTDFDAVPGGTADALSESLGLDLVESFGPVVGPDQVKVVTFVPEEAVDRVARSMADAGAGQIGSYSNCSFRSSGLGSFLAAATSTPTVGEPGEATEVAEVRLEMVARRRDEEAVTAALVAAHPYEEPAFDVYETRSNQGFIGRVGAWSGTLTELAEFVAETLGSTGLRVAGDPEATIRRVAVVPGSGASFVSAARAAGADAIVTGDVDHHRAVAALDSGVAVVDPGHAATERPGMDRLVESVDGLGLEVADHTGDGLGPWVNIRRN